MSRRPGAGGAVGIALALLAGAGLVAPEVVRGAGDPGKAGAYCPLPKAGEKPSCLAPAESEYKEFFAALDEGSVDDQDAARVEAVLADSERDDADYLALSSLAYGYYRMAQQAAGNPETDPVIARRLERWNAILSDAYEAHSGDEGFRSAVRLAATDLHENSPGVPGECLDADGRPVACTTTDALLAQLDRADRVGVRGALARILGRWFGE